MKYFTWGDCSNKGLQVSVVWDSVVPNGDYKNFHFEGSMRLLPARVLGLPYDQYLRLAQSYGARLVGKDSEYVGAIFDRPNDEWLDFLNKRADEVFKYVDIGDIEW